MKRNSALIYFSLITSFLFFSCQIGLGSAVDTRTPNISFDEKIPAAATVKGPFTLNGTWDDDGVISVNITMTNLTSNVSYNWEKISTEKLSLKDGVNKGTWTCSIDPFEKEMKDGKYEIDAYIRDSYGHDRTISKQIILDNTAPVLVISRPTYGINDSNFDSYGQDFFVSGFIGDATSKKYLQVEIYDSNDEDAQPVYTSPFAKVNSEFSVLVASKENEDAALVEAYNKIYGEGTTGTKKLYCKIYAFDDSVNYENSEDIHGNCADYFYLYESLYSTIFEEYDAIDIYDMNSNARTAENTVLEVLENNKISKGQFSINPANNPSFKVSGKDPLNKDQYDFIEGDETYHITNGSTLVVEIEPGLDETPLEGDTLGVYIIEWDSEKYDIKEGAEKYPIIKPVKILSADGVLVNNPDITAEEINDRNDQDKKIFSKSGSTYKFKFTLMHDGIGLQVGKKYIFGIYGYDQKGVAVKNAEDTYGFLFSTNVAPTVKITTPAEYSTYLKAGVDLTVSGTATTEVGKPDVYIYVNETQLVKLEASTLTSSASGSKVETAFTYTIPASVFSDAKSDSGTEEFTIEAKAVYCDLPATTQKTVFYDTQTPVIDITSPAENTWLAAIGNVAISGKISDDLGGVDKVYYSTTTKTDKTDRSKWTELVYTGASFNQNLVTTTAEGKETAYIAFYATDKAGNESDILVREINVDTANPTLSGLKYETGESFTAAAVSAASGTSTPLASDTYVIGGSYSDTGTSVSITATRDGEAVAVTQTGTKSGTWQIAEKEVAEGSHEYEIVATDESGKKVTNKITINADKSEPTVALSERPGKEDTKASSYTFSGTSYDGEKGSGVAGVTVTITDAADATKTHTETASGTTNWSLKVEYESDAWKEVFATEGQKNIVLKATDNAGNVKENAINTFVYDKIDPVLTVTSGATQQYMTSSGFSFAGTASDTYGIDELKLIEKKWENEAWVETEASRNAEAITITGGAWTAKVPLGNVNPTDGRYQYQFVLTDAVDHDTHSVIYSTTVDTTAPVVTITTPAPSENYATDKKSVKMGVSAVNETTYRFAGNLTEANGISGVYYKILESSLGTNPSVVTDVLNASAWTRAGWTVAEFGTANFNFTKDFTSGTTPEETKLGEGHKKLCVYAVDSAGNVSNLVTSLFDVDMGYPTLTSSITLEASEDANHVYIYPKTLKFGDVYYIRNTVDSAALNGTITYNDTNGISSVVYKIDGVDKTSSVTVAGNTWTMAKSLFTADTESLLAITVTDVMGKAITNNYRVYRDETIPTVDIEYPTNPYNADGTFDAEKYVSINATSVQANGTTGDEDGAGVYVIQFTTKTTPAETDWQTLRGYSAGSTTWSQQIDGADFANEGEIVLSVRVKDKLGNVSAVKKVPFSYDKDPPALTIETVGKYQNKAAMAETGAAGFTVKGTACDSNSIDRVEMIVDERAAIVIKTFDSTEKTAGQNTSAADTDKPSWSYTFNNADADTTNNLSDGIHTIEIRLYDIAHRMSSKVVTTTVDTKAPDVKRNERKDANGNILETKIDIPYPTVDETEKSSYRFIGEAEDATTSVVKVELIFADGNLTTPPANATIIDAEGKASWRYNCEFSQLPAFETSGYKTIFVRATDIAGNVSEWAPQSFMYDTGKPEVVFKKFNDGSDVNIGSTENHNAKGEFTLSGNISDDWGFNFGTEQNPTGTFKITQNDVDITSLINPTGEAVSKSWEISGLPRDTTSPTSLSETLDPSHITGVYKYKIIAKDKAGKTTEKSVTISIDTEEPEIQITQPAGNQSRFNYFSGTDYTFYGFATDDGHGTSGLQSYSYQFVKVTDLGNNPDTATKAETETWETVTAPNGNFSIKKSLNNADSDSLSEGKWILYFKAIDKAGNKTDVSNISFWVDQGNPVLTTDTAELITKDNFTLSGTATDTNTNKFLSVNIRDNKSSYTATKQADATDGSWQTDTITIGSGENLADGTHELTITATDVAGRTTQVTKSVVVDTVKPVVTEISKPLGIDFDNATVQITGSVTDATPSSGLNEVYIQFTDGTNSSDAVKVTGTGSWSYTLDPDPADATNKINTVFATQGQKTIKVYALDKAGNQSDEKTQDFIYDTENPTFTVNYAHTDGNSSVENNDALIFKQNGYTLSGTFTDSGSNVTVAVTRDGTDISSSLVITTDSDAADTNGNLKAGKWSLTESSVADGEHTYVVTVTDASERRSSSKFTILVDTKAPELKFTDADKLPDRDNTKATSYTFTGGASDEVAGIKTSGIKDIYVNIADKNDPSLKSSQKATGSTLWTANVAYAGNKDSNSKNAFMNGNTYVEGPKTVTVTISDVAGNTKTITPTNHEFVYDRSDPVLEVTATSIQKYMSKAGFVISGTASDTYQVGNLKIIETKDGTETDDSKAGVFVTLNDINVDKSSAKKKKWEIKVPLSLNKATPVAPTDGKYTYQFILTDTVGHQVESKQYTATVDTTAPSDVTITTPSTTDGVSIKTGTSAIDETTYKFAGSFTEANEMSAVWYKILSYDASSWSDTADDVKAPTTDILSESSWSGWNLGDIGTGSFKFTEDFHSNIGRSATDYGEGNWMLCLYAVDAAGNVSSLVKSQFDVDMSAPSVTTESKVGTDVSELGNATNVLTSAYSFRFSMLDTYGINEKAYGTALNEAPYDITIKKGNDVLAAGKYSVKPGEGTDAGYYLVTIKNDPTGEKQEDGTYEYTVKVKDLVGKETSITKTIQLDTTAPEISITSPNFANYQNASKINISGSALDDSGTLGVYYIYGGTTPSIPVASADVDVKTVAAWTGLGWNAVSSGTTSWTINQLSVDEVYGGKNLYIAAVDKHGNVSSSVYTETVLVDINNPVLTETGITGSSLSTNDGFTLTGVAHDVNKIKTLEVYVQKETDAANAVKYTYDVSDADNATLTYAVNASDDADKVWSKTFVVGSATADTDAGEVKLADGKYTFKITATDNADKQTVITKEVLVDTVKPELKTYKVDTDLITGEYKTENDVLSWVRRTQIPVKVELKPEAAGITASTITTVEYTTGTVSVDSVWHPLSNGSYWNGTIGCVQGTNVITVRAKDAVGNISDTKIINVSVDTMVPDTPDLIKVDGETLESSKLVNGKNDVIFTLKAADDTTGGVAASGIESVTVTKIGKEAKTIPATSETPEDGSYNYSVTIPKDKLATGGVEVTVTDVAGNTSKNILFQIDLDNVPPSVEITSVSTAVAATANTLGKVNGLVTIKGTASDKRALKDNEPVEVLYQITDSAAALNDESDWKTTTEDGSKSIKSGVTKADVTGETVWEVTGVDVSANHGKYLHIRAQATDSALNEKVTEDMVVEIDQNTDRPEIRFTSVKADGSTVLKLTRVSGSIMDDDGDIENFWYFPSVKTENTWSSPSSYPAYSSGSGTWSVPAGWIEVDEHPAGGSFALNAKQANGQEAEDGKIQWYFAVADKNHKLFTTANANTFNQPTIVFEGDAAVANNKVIEFSFDTKPPAITAYKLLHKTNAEIKNLIDNYNNNQTEEGSKIADGKLPPDILAGLITETDWLSERNLAYGQNYKYLYAKVNVFELTEMDADPIETFTYAHNNDITISEANKNFYVDETDKANGNYVYIVGPFDVSSAASVDDYTLQMTVKDKVGNQRGESLPIVIDNTGPQSISEVKPKAAEEITDAFVYSGMMDDRSLTDSASVKGSGVVKVQYYLPKDTETDETAIEQDLWREVSSITSATWQIEFTGENGLSTSKYLDYKKINNSDNYGVSTDYDGYEDNGQGIYNLPIWFKLTDKVGNVGYNTENVIKYNPNAARPSVSITSPEQPNSLEISGTAVRYEVMGGSARISGTAEDDQGIKAVYLQFDLDGDGNWDNTADDVYGSVKITELTSSDVYAVKANGTRNWYYSLDLSNAADVNIETNQKYIRVRAIAIDIDTPNTLSSAWSNIVNISVDNSVPSVNNLKVRQYEDSTKANMIAEKDYSADMYLKGENWYLAGDVHAAGGISGVQIGNTTVAVSDYFTTPAAANPSNLKMEIPVVPVNGIWSETIRITDNSGNSKYTDKTYTIKVDNQPPEFFDKWAAGSPNGTVKHYMNEYGDIRGTPLVATSVMQNSNGTKTTVYGKLTGMNTEIASGFDKVVFYFRRTTAAGTNPRLYNVMEASGTNNTANRTNLTAASRTVGQVYIHNPDSGTSTTDFLPMLYVKDVSGTMTVTRPDEYKIKVELPDGSALTGVAGNKNIRKGGLIRIGGVYRTITSVDYTNGIVEFDSVCDTSIKEAEFVYGMVVSSNGESERADGSINETDGDGMLESYSNASGTVTWSATFNSANIPDGPIEFHVVAFDLAGNAGHGYTKTKVSNNPPRITKVMLGTDLNGNGSYETSEYESFYAVKNNRGETDLTDGKAIWNLDTKAGLGGNDYFTVKNGLAVIPEFVGGTGDIYWKFKKTVLTADELAAATTEEKLTETLNKKVLGTAEKMTSAEISSNKLASETAEGTGNKAGKLILDNSAIGDSGENNTSVFSFSFWDSTEETTYGTDSGSAVLNAFIKQDLTDDVGPKVVVDKFHWYGKGTGNASDKTDEYRKYKYGDVKGNSRITRSLYTLSGSTYVEAETKDLTDDSIVYRKVQVPYNNLYDSSAANGHIELEDDLTFTGSTFTATSGVMDKDPKVSGKITFTGSAYDNVRISTIYFKLTKSNGTSVFAPTDGTAGTGDYSTYYTAASTDSNILKSSHSDDLSDTNNWKFTVTEDYFNQSGHKVNWELSIDTSKITGVAAADLTLEIKAVDAAEKPSTTTDATGDDNLSDAKMNKAKYKMDVVPYITGLRTAMTKLEKLNPSAYGRSATGRYPVYYYQKNASNKEQKETVGILGFNLTGAKVKFTGTTTTATLNTDNEFSVPSAALSGPLTVTVNSVGNLNNQNNDNAKGSYAGAYTDNTYAYCYNRQPNGQTNNNLTDDIEIAVWGLHSRAALPSSGNLGEVTMHINPATGMPGLSFIHGADLASYPMATTSNGTAQANSYQKWTYGYTSVNTVEFVYDAQGHMFGTHAGTDTATSSKKASRFRITSSIWGLNSDFSKQSDYNSCYGKQNALRLEYQALQSPSFVAKPDRIQNPRMATSIPSASKATTNLYLMYYDTLTNELKFRAGSLANTEEFNNGNANNVYTTGDDTKDRTKDGVVFSSAGTKFGDFVDDAYMNNSNYKTEYTHCSIVTNSTSDYKASKYYAIAVVPEAVEVTVDGTTAKQDVIVAVWYDASNGHLWYSYLENPLAKAGNRASDGALDTSWHTPVKIIDGSAGGYCAIAVDEDNHIHIASYSKEDAGSLIYTYLDDYKGWKSAEENSCTVDSYGTTGWYLTMDIAKDSSGHTIPYIGYYMTSMQYPKYAYLVDTESSGKNGATWAPKAGTDDNNLYTGAWESIMLPTQSTVKMDDINIGVWKSLTAENGAVKGQIKAIPKEDESGDGSANTTTGTVSGTVYGNGSLNPLFAYAIDNVTTSYVETAQLK